MNEKSGKYASQGITAGSFVAELGLPARTERCDVRRRNDYRQKAICLNIDNYFLKTLNRLLSPIRRISFLAGGPGNKFGSDPFELAVLLPFPTPPYPLAPMLCFYRLFGFVYNFPISEDVCLHISSY
jgi:hypothetical protein